MIKFSVQSAAYPKNLMTEHNQLDLKRVSEIFVPHDNLFLSFSLAQIGSNSMQFKI